MARIPLRAYNREVENLIERGQIEEAIAHCKNILKQFPKHIETYRLLGKAFLESQRYAEAADILQRVLSVYPDDFVSHLGMSIIREDEGNLDAAIWHMERAYEVQPFNRPVQDELRRLYGRRDGAEPPRIRLTRGALVRMYARGDLYPQAIAEIRAALAEDPSRIDLITLLARMYYLSGQKIEATEICSSLIGKLPYCYEANRVLMEVLPETSRAEDARIFQQRLFSLDPYAAFISPNAPTSAQVPEQTVMVEKVDWQPSMAEAQGPDWARNIGVQWEETSEEALPDWLNTIDAAQAPAAEETAAPEALAEEEIAAPPAGGAEIPGFLQEAGWTVSDGTTAEQPVSFIEEEEPSSAGEGEAVEAEIPDWLQSLAPASTALPESEETTEDAGKLEWLEGILPPAAGALADEAQPMVPAEGEAPSLEQPPAEEFTPQAAQPDWLSETPLEGTLPAGEAAEEAPAAEAGALPDWLTELGAPAGEETLAEAPSVEETGFPAEEVPDWIRQAELEPPVEAEAEKLEQPVEEPVAEESVPDWLSELKQEEPAQTAGPADEITAPTQPLKVAGQPADEWLPESSTPQVEEAPQAAAPALDSMDMDAALAWMEGLAAKQGADEESLKISAPEERSETPPEWLQQLQGAEVETQAEVEAAAPLEEAPAQAVEAALPAAEPGAAPEDLDAALAWMEALAAKQGADEESLKISAPEERSETPPDWIQEIEAAQAGITPLEEAPQQMESSAATEEAAAWEAPAAVEEPVSAMEEPGAPADEAVSPPAAVEELPEPALPEMETAVEEPLPEAAPLDADSAFAWMEALAAKQGAEEGTLVTAPEERPEAPPEWVAETLEEPAPQAAQTEAEPVSAEAPLPQAEEEPAAEVAPGEGLPFAEAVEPAVEALEEKTAPIEPAAMEAETLPAEEAPLAETPTPAAQPAAGEVEIPEWLRSYEEEQRTQEPVWQPDETFTPEAVADEELPAWLREEPPAEPEVVLPPVQAEVEAPGAETEPATVESGMPEWLKELQESQPPAEAPARVEEPAAPARVEAPISAPPSDAIALARAALRSGDIEGAAEQYTRLINASQNLDEVVHDLQGALDQHPVDVSLWQALGDAYMRIDRVQDALDAYTKAEELLR